MVPVLVTLGVKATGERIIIDLRLAAEEGAGSRGEVVASLIRRNIGAPVLAVIDGNPGLEAALKAQWPGIAFQRCTNHKLWNLEAKAPARLRDSCARDYRRMIYARTRRPWRRREHPFSESGSSAARRWPRGSRRRPTSAGMPLSRKWMLRRVESKTDCRVKEV